MEIKKKNLTCLKDLFNSCASPVEQQFTHAGKPQLQTIRLVT